MVNEVPDLKSGAYLHGWKPAMQIPIGWKKAYSTGVDQTAVEYFSLPNHRTAWRQNWP
jgi:hypothetical protein